MYPEVKTYLTGTMFDEVYHGRTAYEFLHKLTTYETTHPHLGKILISFGIIAFGMNRFRMAVHVCYLWYFNHTPYVSVCKKTV